MRLKIKKRDDIILLVQGHFVVVQFLYMPTKGAQNQWAKFFSSRWFLLALLTASLLTSFAYGRAYYQDYQVRQEIERLQNEVKKMETKKLETIEILKYVKSPDFIEEKARTELNLIKPGEQVALIHDADKSAVNSNEQTAPIRQKPASNPAKWWKLFLGGLPNHLE